MLEPVRRKSLFGEFYEEMLDFVRVRVTSAAALDQVTSMHPLFYARDVTGTENKLTFVYINPIFVHVTGATPPLTYQAIKYLSKPIRDSRLSAASLG